MERVPGSGTIGTQGGGQGTQATEQAKQQGQQLAQQARQQAGELANRGAEQVKSQLANQKHDASQRMVPVQSALRETAQQLRKQGQGNVGQYADRAADQVERFSGYLRETEVDEIVDEARGFARRRPALFLGAAAALGFFGTRFLKSSSQQAGGSSGNDYGVATSNTAVTHGGGEPTTALPPGPAAGTAVGDTPTVRRAPMTDRPLGDPPPLGGDPSRLSNPPRGV